MKWLVLLMAATPALADTIKPVCTEANGVRNCVVERPGQRPDNGLGRPQAAVPPPPATTPAPRYWPRYWPPQGQYAPVEVHGPHGPPLPYIPWVYRR